IRFEKICGQRRSRTHKRLYKRCSVHLRLQKRQNAEENHAPFETHILNEEILSEIYGKIGEKMEKMTISQAIFKVSEIQSELNEKRYALS
ncbi:hypothetical protein NL444_27075, partial [Klebsiella pneumoniae]|nr:hypothetical protein [Klebsiella pneumoniae]